MAALRKNRKADFLRQNLGLSQELMAMWLGISRSLYSMYEAQDRTLPKKASSKYLDLLQDWTRFQEDWNPSAKEPETPPEEQPSSLKLDQKISRLEYQLLIARRNLRELNEQPDHDKALAFFAERLEKSTDPLEQNLCRIQQKALKEEKDRVKKEKKRLETELEFLPDLLEVLKKKRASLFGNPS